VLLNNAAPSGGLNVALSSDDPAVAVPPSVTVPAGRDSADFDVTAQAVPADRQASIVGSVPERSASASLALWSVQPTFFSFTNDPPYFSGVAPARRVLPPSGAFYGFCSGRQVEVQVSEGSRDTWFARVTAPPNRPLAVGTYDVTASTVNGPNVFLAGAGLNCSSGWRGRFTVREADYAANGNIRHFWMTVDFRCSGTGPLMRGDLRVSGIATGNPPPPFALSCTVP